MFVQRRIPAVVFLTLCLMVSAVPLYAGAQFVTVSAQGVVSVKPDIANLQVRLAGTAGSAERATAIAANKYKAVQQALRTNGVKASDAVTSSFSVQEQWEWDNSTRKRIFKGYTATHMLRVTVRQLDRTGKVIDAAVKAGADGIPTIGFSSSIYPEKRREALAEAVRNAQKDARAMASAAGMSLGSLQEISSGASPVFPVANMVRGAEEKMLASPVSTDISPGEQQIRVTVMCRWILEGR